MKMIKMALLGGAALAVTSVGAYADDLAALKAQVESLNARVAQMEAVPSVPNGYSLLTISEGSQPTIPGLEVLAKDAHATGEKATVIGILPTADAPATTEITWSGYARAAIVYVDYGDDTDDLDVYARGQIKVTGKTETAVGEIGATIEYRGNFDGQRSRGSAGVFNGRGNVVGLISGNHDVYIEQAWGYWAMTPELTLGGGFAGSLGNIGYGYDGACLCYYTDNADVALNPGDTSQMRLTYGSGPLSLAIAIEDASGNGAGFSGNGSGADDKLGVAAEMKYTGDTINGEVSGLWRAGAEGPGFDDVYAVGAGIGFSLGDIAAISAGAQVGQYNNGQDFWRASILASANLSDEIHAEVAYGYTSDNIAGNTVNAILAGVYYDPVSQLTIGLEGEWYDVDAPGTDSVTQVDLVTIFRF
jgi:hypothetical protein